MDILIIIRSDNNIIHSINNSGKKKKNKKKIIWTRLKYTDPRINYFIILLTMVIIITIGISLGLLFGQYNPGDDCFYKEKKLEKYIFNSDTKKCFPVIPCLFKSNGCAAFNEVGDELLLCGRYNSSLKSCN
jgi:hypothetical protein